MVLVNKKKVDKYTYEDYLRWPNEERWELIGGIPYNMTPAPSRIHQKVLGKLFTKFHIDTPTDTAVTSNSRVEKKEKYIQTYKSWKITDSSGRLLKEGYSVNKYYK